MTSPQKHTQNKSQRTTRRTRGPAKPAEATSEPRAAGQAPERTASGATSVVERAGSVVVDATRRAQRVAAHKLQEAQRFVGESLAAAGESIVSVGKRLQG